MPVGMLGRKVGMTQVYDEAGDLIPVTVIEAGPCVVLQLRSIESDGYEAVQLGFGDKPRRLASRSERGHVVALGSKRQKRVVAAGGESLPKADCEPKRFVREFRTDGEEHGLSVGQELGVGVFADVPFVDVIGVSKGRGFAGVMKRHNFAGQRASHGVKRVHRHGGSIGMSADPARVLRGTKMPGRYGNAHRTIRHLKVVRVDGESNLLLVRGAVPGPNGGELIIRHTNRRTGRGKA
ncbi:MAG: 50S ribosomal protein L3 [Planctomycetaceae bacterium]|jgi:large subunit ribosomal protein L3|nr:50S ribosomal protein L3 [Planctomycetaceae bacterium]MBT6483753.1 50S ribosomal protein L3 [Planctomycetaceae bacterium]MBT6494551.1 50S ribosomal protein L3 [Planctomycetaceae bacterium]